MRVIRGESRCLDCRSNERPCLEIHFASNCFLFTVCLVGLHAFIAQKPSTQPPRCFLDKPCAGMLLPDIASIPIFKMNSSAATWGFPKIRCTTLGVPIIRTTVFWGLYWGPPILGNYHLDPLKIPKHLPPNHSLASLTRYGADLLGGLPCLPFLRGSGL